MANRDSGSQLDPKEAYYRSLSDEDLARRVAEAEWKLRRAEQSMRILKRELPGDPEEAEAIFYDGYNEVELPARWELADARDEARRRSLNESLVRIARSSIHADGYVEPFGNQVARYRNGEMPDNEYLVLPVSAKGYGLPVERDAPLLLRQKTLKKIELDHEIDLGEIAELPVWLSAHPLAMESITAKDALVVFADARDDEGNEIVVALHMGKTAGQRGYELIVDEIASVYGKANVSYFIENTAKAGKPIYVNERTRGWLSRTGVQFPQLATSLYNEYTLERVKSPDDVPLDLWVNWAFDHPALSSDRPVVDLDELQLFADAWLESVPGGFGAVLMRRIDPDGTVRVTDHPSVALAIRALEEDGDLIVERAQDRADELVIEAGPWSRFDSMTSLASGTDGAQPAEDGVTTVELRCATADSYGSKPLEELWEEARLPRLAKVISAREGGWAPSWEDGPAARAEDGVWDEEFRADAFEARERLLAAREQHAAEENKRREKRADEPPPDKARPLPSPTPAQVARPHRTR